MKQQVQRLIRLTKAQDDKLRKIAFDKRVSVAELIRQIVEESLKK
jgi:predicted DNA-binding ribbon-helix-helix protein